MEIGDDMSKLITKNDLKAIFDKILPFSTVVHKTYTASNLSNLSSVVLSIEHWGKVGLVRIYAISGSSAVAIGSNATFHIDDLPLMASNSRGSGYTGSACFVANITTDGDVTIRVTGAQWSASTGTEIYVPVIFK